MLESYRHATIALVRSDAPDLSQRQMAVLLALHDAAAPQTVRGLAAFLQVHPPAITRAMDRLTELDFAERLPDPNDRRSVWLRITPAGCAFVARLGGWLSGDARRAA